MLQYDLEFDVSCFQLRTKNYKTCNLRLTAFASRHRTDPSAAEGRRWISDESIKNKTHKYLCHKDFFQDLDTLLDPLATTKYQTSRSWRRQWQQAKRMTMVVEFSGVKIENYEDKDMMNFEDS